MDKVAKYVLIGIILVVIMIFASKLGILSISLIYNKFGAEVQEIGRDTTGIKYNVNFFGSPPSGTLPCEVIKGGEKIDITKTFIFNDEQKPKPTFCTFISYDESTAKQDFDKMCKLPNQIKDGGSFKADSAFMIFKVSYDYVDQPAWSPEETIKYDYNPEDAKCQIGWDITRGKDRDDICNGCTEFNFGTKVACEIDSVDAYWECPNIVERCCVAASYSGEIQFTALYKGIECLNGQGKCIGLDNYVCENYKWVNKGRIIGKCGVEEEKIKVYRLTNNECSEIEIKESEKGYNDFDTLEKCKEKIIVKTIYYRIGENKCLEVNIYPYEKTENDSVSLEECEKNIKKSLVLPLLMLLLIFAGLIGLVWFLVKRK